mgnify:CR=1 FL=1
MNLLFVVHRYGYPGGSEQYTRDMAEESLRRGHSVAVFAGEHSGNMNGVYVTSDTNIFLSSNYAGSSIASTYFVIRYPSSAFAVDGVVPIRTFCLPSIKEVFVCTTLVVNLEIIESVVSKLMALVVESSVVRLLDTFVLWFNFNTGRAIYENLLIVDSIIKQNSTFIITSQGKKYNICLKD